MVCDKKRNEVAEILSGISAEKDIRILYACESGSRAWGFASQDSDYDVRFVYAHSRDWYLSVNSESKKDVVDLPINDLMDVGGWDLRKALRLMLKSNSPLLEWLHSPIVYQAESEFVAEMQRFAKLAFTPIASAYHYLSMAKKNAEIIFCGRASQTQKVLLSVASPALYPLDRKIRYACANGVCQDVASGSDSRSMSK